MVTALKIVLGDRFNQELEGIYQKAFCYVIEQVIQYYDKLSAETDQVTEENKEQRQGDNNITPEHTS